MKSLVLSAIICAATGMTAVNAHATVVDSRPEKVHEQKSVETFKQTIAYHQRNIDVLFEQYELAEARIRNSKGNHAELDRDKAFFISVYEQDIKEGVRVEQSKQAIEEINANYAKKHAEREAWEKEQIAQLQTHLHAELKKEKKRFDKTKKAYADFINTETMPLLEAAERRFSWASEQIGQLKVATVTHAAR